MSSRTRSRKQASIGSNHSLRRPTPISASEPRTGNFVLLLVMAWSPPAHNAGNVRVSAPGDYGASSRRRRDEGANPWRGAQALLDVVPLQWWGRLADNAVRGSLLMAPDVIAIHLTQLEGPHAAEHVGRLRREWRQDHERA